MQSCQIQVWEVTGTKAERLTLPNPLQNRARFFETDTGNTYEWNGVNWLQVAASGVALQAPAVTQSGTPQAVGSTNPLPTYDPLFIPILQLEALNDIALSLRVVINVLRQGLNVSEDDSTMRNDEQVGPAVNLN